SKDISSMVRRCARGLLFVIAALSSLAQSAAAGTPQPPDPEMALAADRFERFVFPPGEDRVGELVDKSPIMYGLLEKRENGAGVEGLWNGAFARLSFDRHIPWLTSSGKPLVAGLNPRGVDVLAVAADGPPPADRVFLLQAMGITATSLEWRDTQV